MKNIIKKSLEFITIVLVIAGLIVTTGCNNKQAKSTNESTTVSATQTASPPAVDIHTAVMTEDLQALKQHIEAKSDINLKESMVGNTPLMVAAVFGKHEAAKLLLAAGAEVNIRNVQGSTALHSAAFFGRTEMVKDLLDHNADKNIKNAYGATALESVSGPFENMRSFYDQLVQDLGPLGLKLDYDQLKKDRITITHILK